MEELLFGLQEEESENAVIPAPEFVFGSGSGLLDAADSEFIMSGPGADSEEASTIRAKIASHPLYPKLLQSYIDCRKVGAPPDVAEIFDEIGGERESGGGDASTTTATSVVLPSFGVDPDLDNFMESYCDILIKLKSDLCKPFDEATMFLDSMRTELSRLCSSDGGASETTCTFDDGAGSSEEDNMISVVGDDEMEIISLERFRMNRDRELKDKLFQKYSGYISSLKHDFFKNKKNVKLPNHSRQILLNWWNLHYAWPYPTESDKAVLAVATGLDPKQINNWFINQRKRHWKTPEENMQQFTANNN